MGPAAGLGGLEKRRMRHSSLFSSPTGIRTANCPTRGLVTVLIALSRLLLVEGVLPNVEGLYSLVINYESGLMSVTEEEVRVGRGAKITLCYL